MPHHFIERTLPYSQEQLFNLVSDIEQYPKFIPWCKGARVLEKENNIIIAELLINFKAISGRYTSRVILDEQDKEISVELMQGPFHHLYNGWKFKKTRGGTLVEFDIDFKIRSFVLEKIVNSIFGRAMAKIMASFEARAKELYG